MRHILAILAVVTLGLQAFAQSFVNGDFETGNMTGWTITVGENARYLFQEVVPFDINSTDPGGLSLVAQFSVGQINLEPDVYRSVFLTQELALVAGTTYDISYDWAVHNYFFLDNFDGGVFDVLVDGAPIASWDTQDVWQNATEWGTLSGQFTALQSGSHTIGARMSRRFPVPLPGLVLGQYLDNFHIEAAPVPEPGAILALSLGLAALSRRRRTRKASYRT